ncbi:MAG: hypothetical protein H6619_00775 [Deltaproteobacteria bacterium]|nr:hypothetical protein [Deltaproteobacteria bacterium]
MNTCQKTTYYNKRPTIAEQYKTIGRELLQYEERCRSVRSLLDLSAFGFTIPFNNDIESFFKRSLRVFKRGVEFIPLNILESYLEDLLDLDVNEERLFIAVENKVTRSFFFALFGLLFALSVGLYSVSIGASFPLAFFITVFLAVPFGALWHLVPRDKLSRRMRFAKLLSAEINQRKGGTGPFVMDPLRSKVRGLFDKPSFGSAYLIH